jgi:hypothetical protein
MAFRSELEAAQHRAEAAESETHRLKLELTSQAARIDRVAEIEGQLEVARAKLREQGPKNQTVAVLVGGLLGMAIAGGGMYFMARRGDAAARATAAEGEERHERELIRANAERDDARLELGIITAERDDAHSSLDDTSREMRTVLLALGDAETPEDGPTHPVRLGRVVEVHGAPPVRSRTFCDVMAPASTECAGTIRCNDVPLHSFGCRGRATTEMRAEGFRIRVSHPDWWVAIDTQQTE